MIQGKGKSLLCVKGGFDIMGHMKNSTFAIWTAMALRFAIGWHFLYEGLWKLAQGGNWSCQSYLRMSRWVAAPIFNAMAESPTVVAVCDQLMMWGLVAIGLSLITGVFARWAAVVGAAMLAMFYVAMPPFTVSGGYHHFLYVDTGVVEACALLFVVACPGPGLWQVVKAVLRRYGPVVAVVEGAPKVALPDRREVIAGLASLPVLGAFASAFVAKHGVDAFSRKKDKAETVTSASYRFKYQDIGDLKKKFDQFVQIGDFKMSRITLGGNLIGGWAHSRDLGYVSTLMKAYNTEKRIFDTMHLAEACGVNTISTNPSLMNFIKKYWREDGGTINFVSDCGHADVNGELGIVVGAKKSVDAGAKLIYIHGFGADKWAVEGNWKVMEKALREMRKLGVPVGIGAHAFATLKFCVEHDLIPDFWMKTFHPGGYWSAQKTPQDQGEGEPGSGHKGWRDNNWCRDPKALSEWFEKRPEPWIAFKTMAAGAVHPRQAIPFVFNGGADAACMGMFDFQVVEDVNLAVDAFAKGFPNRRRKWC